MRIAIFALLSVFAGSASADERWEEAERRAQQLNDEIGRQGARWTAGVTWVSLLDKEQQRWLVGAPDDLDEFGPVVFPEVPAAAMLPSSWDWRDYGGNFITGVKNQRSCGTCAIFAATAALEASCNIFEDQPGRDLDLSEQVLTSCLNGDCIYGWDHTDALNFFQSTGTALEACMPYQWDDTVPCADACPDLQTDPVGVSSWTAVGSDVDDMKTALLNGLLITKHEVFEDYTSYSGGVYSYVEGDSLGWHSILIVGWNDADGAWIVKNSWGTNWGENTYGLSSTEGYYRIAYGECGIGSSARLIQSVYTPTCPDSDGDGFTKDLCGGEDCHDGDATVYPGAPEICDHQDNNCDGEADEGLWQDIYYVDEDDDGYGNGSLPIWDCDAFLGTVDNDEDCDDADPDQHPGAIEACNGEDDDCDGLVDEGALISFYLDEDGDGYGVDDSLIEACSAEDGYVDAGGDCDDEDDEVFPGQDESCDGIDNDCDGEVDEGVCGEDPDTGDGDEELDDAGRSGCECSGSPGPGSGATCGLLGALVLLVLQRRRQLFL